VPGLSDEQKAKGKGQKAISCSKIAFCPFLIAFCLLFPNFCTQTLCYEILFLNGCSICFSISSIATTNPGFLFFETKRGAIGWSITLDDFKEQ